MPEGDTIHHAARRIGAALAGRVPEEILTPHPRQRLEDWPGRLAGRAVRVVEARSKHLLIRFEGGLTLHSHLRMSGAWSVHARGQRWRRTASRAWLVMRAGGWEVVQFDGPVLELMSDARALSDPRLTTLGPDVLGERFDTTLFLARLRADDQERTIGEALLDQRTLAGIGNLWKSEACFGVGLDPWLASGAVSHARALAAVQFAREHMRRSAIEGSRARPRAVYRRAGLACVRCGAPIRARRQGDDNRITYWCACCQY
jgi:endonuclease-8